MYLRLFKTVTRTCMFNRQITNALHVKTVIIAQSLRTICVWCVDFWPDFTFTKNYVFFVWFIRAKFFSGFDVFNSWSIYQRRHQPVFNFSMKIHGWSKFILGVCANCINWIIKDNWNEHKLYIKPLCISCGKFVLTLIEGHLVMY